MRKILTSFSLVAASLAFAQVGINADENDIAKDAVFHVKNKGSEAKGVILPSVSLTGEQDQTTITTGLGISQVTTGLLVWNDGNSALKPAGYYYWDGAKWVLTGNKDGGSSANIYSEDGPLEGDRVVTHDNHDLTFTTGTGEFVIDGTSRLSGASYVNTTVVGDSTNPVTTYDVQPNDYYLAVQSTANQVVVNLPLPENSVGRVLIISNDASRNVAINLNGSQALNGTDSPSITKNKAMWIISDGKRWYNLINY